VTGPILGWDIGGANLKAARIEHACSEARIVERPFALWREPNRLPAMLVETAAQLGQAELMAITMTAELADCFASKREGVVCVLDAFRAAFPDVDARVYGVDGRFRALAAAQRRSRLIAAANWRASAALVARTMSDVLFIDVGSTTTDVIPIVGGQVVARAKTDPGRLRTGALVYTGLLRTPVCAVARWLPLGGRRCRVAAEHFAIVADAHLWLGRIGADDYTCETPDGRGRSRCEAGARLARMVCGDLDMVDADAVTTIAEHIVRAQVRQIAEGIRQVMRPLGAGCPRAAIVAGHGAALGREAAGSVGLDVIDMRDTAGEAIARATPAAAVAYLLAALYGTEAQPQHA
jgi:(4-(4-[2-(gamma-L-glutamylamino)ethyl]phenoxymethyl)furan-2-yl)methanamine synthase